MKTIVLSQAWQMTKAEAKKTFENLKRAGLIPDDVDVQFIRVPGAPVVVKQFRPNGSTAGARFLVREGR